MIKIIFFGSDWRSKLVLSSLKKDKRFEIVKVVTNKDDLAQFKSLTFRPDVGILASFGVILSQEVIDFPKKGILNIHPSLLPKYRGTSPVQAAILAGDKQTGVSIIKIDEKVDHGPILSQFEELIRPEDTAESLEQRLFAQGTEVLKTILSAYLKGQIKPKEQNHQQATYTKKLNRDDGKIDWSKPPEFIERQIRAYYPWPGTWTEIHLRGEKSKRLKILKAHLKNGKLVPDLVQLEGKKPVRYTQFLEGYPEVKIIS